MRILPKICWLALMASSFAHAEELGRLFFTPAQRAQMDYNYAQNAQPSDNVNAVMLNGIVQMQGGKRTAWINGVPQAVGRSDDKAPESVPVAAARPKQIGQAQGRPARVAESIRKSRLVRAGRAQAVNHAQSMHCQFQVWSRQTARRVLCW